MGAWLRDRLPERVDVAGDAGGRAIRLRRRPSGRARTTPTRRTRSCGSTATCRDEADVPGAIHVIHHDERLVVVDKPPFLSSIPRGRHVHAERRRTPARRAGPAGALAAAPPRPGHVRACCMLATERRWRGAVPDAVRGRRGAQDVPGAGAGAAGPELPVVVRNHLRRSAARGRPRSCPDAPVNAETLVELESRHGDVRRLPADARAPAAPTSCACTCTGSASRSSTTRSTPSVHDIEVDDFSRPLQLLAAELAFTDPFDGTTRRFESVRSLPL